MRTATAEQVSRVALPLANRVIDTHTHTHRGRQADILRLLCTKKEHECMFVKTKIDYSLHLALPLRGTNTFSVLQAYYI